MTKLNGSRVVPELSDRDFVELAEVSSFASLHMDNFMGLDASPDSIIDDLRETPYYKFGAAEGDKPTILSNLWDLVVNRSATVDIASFLYPDKRLLHLSIAGSTVNKTDPGDLDMNAVVEGDFFDYSEFKKADYPDDPIWRVTNSEKVSFITIGSDFFDPDKSPEELDQIPTPGYIHQDLAAREMLVYKLRNVRIFGANITSEPTVGELTSRVLTGLEFADNTINGLVPRYVDPEVRARKASARIREANLILRIMANNLY